MSKKQCCLSLSKIYLRKFNHRMMSDNVRKAITSFCERIENEDLSLNTNLENTHKVKFHLIVDEDVLYDCDIYRHVLGAKGKKRVSRSDFVNLALLNYANS